MKQSKEQEEAEKLNYLFSKYSPENIEKSLAFINQLPFKDILEQIETDLNVST